MGSYLPGQSFPVFLEALSAFGELHGPRLAENGIITFQPLHSPGDLLLGCQRPLLPPKKYLLPPVETILDWTAAEGYRPTTSGKAIVLLGLHPCDLAGITYLDGIFLDDPPDPSYSTRRAGITLIGLSCEPDEYCFCGSLGTAIPAPYTYDLFLQAAKDGFYISSGSSRGEELHYHLSWLFEHREPPPLPPCEVAEEEMIRKAASRGEKFSDSPLWEEFAASCLSCGACSLCCPTCYCFDIREYGELDPTKSFRIRDWDNCLFRNHGEIAGGHNFRPSRVDRFRYRFQHKYLGFGPTRGIISCVGCGRCREVCPVRIDMLRFFGEAQT